MASHIRQLATAEGRAVGTNGHELAKAYILEQLSLSGLHPHTGESFEIQYDRDGRVYSNLVGILEGKYGTMDPILVGAHYDSITGTPGADDNAAAVAILLEMAKDLTAQTLGRTLICSFFDAEEPPHFLTGSMGSTRYYKDQRNSSIHCALIMDLVGHDVPIPGYEDLLFLTGMESQEELSEIILKTTPPALIRPIPILNSYIGDLSDHHVFRENEVPYIFMSCGIWAHYHSPTDTPDRLNYSKINRIKCYLSDLIKEIDKREFASVFEGYDSTPIEAHFINETLGGLLPSGKISSRLEIDAAVHAIALNFGL